MHGKRSLFADFSLNLQVKLIFATMNRRLLPLVVLFSVVFLLASCLSSDDSDITYYEDTAITSFSVGTLNQYLTTKSSQGTDSTYKTTVSGSKYKFYIDQANCLIYNVDSLPYGVDASKVVCTISSKNSGTVVLKSMTSDSLSLYSSSDSIDFSQPREVRVYSNSQSNYRTYTIRVNVHKEEADSFKWSAITTNTDLGSLTAMKAVSANSNLYVFGIKSGSAVVYSASTASATTWTQLTPNVTLGTDAYKNVVVYGDALYVFNDGTLLTSTDATSWTTVAALGSDASRLAGVSSLGFHVLGTDGKMYLVEHGATTMTEETLDSNASYLPTQDLNWVTLPVQGSSLQNLILVGNRDAATYTSDAAAMLWSKVVVSSQYAETEPWSYYAATSSYVAPRLNNLQAIGYEGGMLAIGGAGLGANTETAFSKMYYSADGGLTWKQNASYKFPSDFSSSPTSFTMTVDADKFIWIICGESGQVWRGRKNSAGWATTQTTFTE